MTKNQIKVINEIIADPTTKGKEQLKHILWINTTHPKYLIGDCFKVTDTSEKICDIPVRNLKAKIVCQYACQDVNEYYYELEVVCKKAGKPYIATVHQTESDLYRAERCDDNVNTLD